MWGGNIFSKANYAARFATVVRHVKQLKKPLQLEPPYRDTIIVIYLLPSSYLISKVRSVLPKSAPKISRGTYIPTRIGQIVVIEVVSFGVSL